MRGNGFDSKMKWLLIRILKISLANVEEALTLLTLLP